jgi:hypothetical protein
MWGLATHLALKFDLDETKNPAGVPGDGAGPLRPRPRS